MFEEATSTLLCGDLFTQVGNGPPITDGDIVEPSIRIDRPPAQRFATSPTLSRMFWPQCTARHSLAMGLPR
jgi:hypothetical protein